MKVRSSGGVVDGVPAAICVTDFKVDIARRMLLLPMESLDLCHRRGESCPQSLGGFLGDVGPGATNVEEGSCLDGFLVWTTDGDVHQTEVVGVVGRRGGVGDVALVASLLLVVALLRVVGFALTPSGPMEEFMMLVLAAWVSWTVEVPLQGAVVPWMPSQAAEVETQIADLGKAVVKAEGLEVAAVDETVAVFLAEVTELLLFLGGIRGAAGADGVVGA